MIIYKATNKINGMEYVGATARSLKQRISLHLSDARRKSNGMAIAEAIREYGADNFEWTILHDNIETVEDLDRLEIYYIGYYDTYNNGYNQTLGGKGMRGMKFSDEHKQKIVKARIGEKASEKTKKKMSESGKNKPPISEKTRKKMSEARIGKKNPMYGKRGNGTPMYGKTGGNHPTACAVIIGDDVFDTIKEAGEFIGITSSTIRYRIRHKTKWLKYQYK